METSIKKVGADYLTKYVEKDTSLEGMDAYRILPIMKIVQSTTAKEIKSQFGEGSVIVQPGNLCVWKEGDEPFLFVPHLFFVEFCKWRDLKDKDGPMILKRSFDQTHEIARKSRDVNLRYEPYPGHEARPESDQWKYRYVEHLRFIGVIYDGNLKSTECTLSFERGEFWQGKNFISAIKMRKHTVEDQTINIPLWAQVWAFSVGFRDRGDRKWYGYDFSIPEQSLIEEHEAPEMEAAHKEMRKLKEDERLLVDDTIEDEAAVEEGAEY